MIDNLYKKINDGNDEALIMAFMILSIHANHSDLTVNQSFFEKSKKIGITF
jgi:hypothetical protein